VLLSLSWTFEPIGTVVKTAESETLHLTYKMTTATAVTVFHKWWVLVALSELCYIQAN